MDAKETKVVFSVLTVNHPGVLLRVTGLFSRRGFNIDSIVACSTEKPEFSRWTLVVTGDEATFYPTAPPASQAGGRGEGGGAGTGGLLQQRAAAHQG